MTTKSKKTVCPISRAEFLEKAQPMSITINDQAMQAPPREFSTGSLGWNLNSKTTMNIGGVPVTVQIGMNVTVVGSKELPGRAVPEETKTDEEEPAA